MFTNQSTEEVKAWFSQYCEKDFARAGFVAPQCIELKEGQLPSATPSTTPSSNRYNQERMRKSM